MSRASLFEVELNLSVPGLIGKNQPGNLADPEKGMPKRGVSKPLPVKAFDSLLPFMSQSQLSALAHCLRGEEKQCFFDKVAALADLISSMPVTYQQDGKGDQAVAYLHYFFGNSDWYITEKDVEGGVQQAFGYAILNGDMDCAEMGYISISELVGLVNANVELDLYFKPCTLAEVKSRHALSNRAILAHAAMKKLNDEHGASEELDPQNFMSQHFVFSTVRD
jgi:hypothetical protein